jgi:hypothetical protein
VSLCYSVQVPDDSTNTYVRALKDTISEDVCMVLVILPSNRKDRYDAIKTICCIESAGETQLHNNLYQIQLTLYINVLYKLNQIVPSQKRIVTIII